MDSMVCNERLRQVLFVGACPSSVSPNQAASLPRHGCCNCWSASRASSPLSLWPNKMARVIWAMMAMGKRIGVSRPPFEPRSNVEGLQ